jgi:hypothetical protein
MSSPCESSQESLYVPDLDQLRSFDRVTPEQRVILNRLRCMIIWNPYRPDVAKRIEETVGMLSQISTCDPVSSSRNPDRVKDWLHRNSCTWGHQPETPPCYGAPSSSPQPKKGLRKAPCPGGAPVAPLSPSTPVFQRPPQSEQPGPGPLSTESYRSSYRQYRK